jgi:hypothetical protein
MKHKMSRMPFLAALACLVSACGSKQSALESERLEKRRAQAAAAVLQQSEIDRLMHSLNVLPLIPEDVDWTYRLHAQDHFSTVGGRRVFVEIEVRDIVKLDSGYVVSGEAAEFTYPVIIAIRLRGVGGDVVRSVGRFGGVACIGEHRVSTPTSPYFEARAIDEDEVEIEYSVMPLIVDVDCSHAWSRI